MKELASKLENAKMIINYACNFYDGISHLEDFLHERDYVKIMSSTNFFILKFMREIEEILEDLHNKIELEEL